MIGTLISGLFTLGGKFIEDKDKKTEFAFKTQEIFFQMLTKLVEVKTVPWVDALVKLMAASITMMRPIGSFALTVLGVYIDAKGYAVNDTMTMALQAAFPGWMAARQIDKHKPTKKKEMNFDDGEGW